MPHYVFNADHLWEIHSRDFDRDVKFRDYCREGRFWKNFDPSFAAGVHNTIYDQALKGKFPAGALSAIKRKSLWLDANILTYDPRDHFDNGYITEGWDKVNARLAQFRADNTDWDSFGAAAHAIGDFYAHSSYMHFAVLQNVAPDSGQAVIYAPGVALVASPQYTAMSRLIRHCRRSISRRRVLDEHRTLDRDKAAGGAAMRRQTDFGEIRPEV